MLKGIRKLVEAVMQSRLSTAHARYGQPPARACRFAASSQSQCNTGMVSRSIAATDAGSKAACACAPNAIQSKSKQKANQYRFIRFPSENTPTRSYLQSEMRRKGADLR